MHGQQTKSANNGDMTTLAEPKNTRSSVVQVRVKSMSYKKQLKHTRCSRYKKRRATKTRRKNVEVEEQRQARPYNSMQCTCRARNSSDATRGLRLYPLARIARWNTYPPDTKKPASPFPEAVDARGVPAPGRIPGSCRMYPSST